MTVGALAGAAVGGGGLAWQFWPQPPLQFDTAGVPAGYRRLITSAGGGGITAALAGLSPKRNAPRLSGQALCEVTFEKGPMAPGSVRIASFSDYFCPYCRVLDETLRDLFGRDARVHFIWHQVPLLGRASDMAARGILAARAQGVEQALHKRLIRTSFVPNPAYLRDFARSAGIDAARFMADLNAPQTEAQLARSAAAFAAFGFVGTPGLVIGRTLVNGVISKSALRALVAQEIEGPPPPGCS